MKTENYSVVVTQTIIFIVKTIYIQNERRLMQRDSEISKWYQK